MRPRCGSEIKALLFLLYLPEVERESGLGWDTGLIKPKQDACEQLFAAQSTVIDSGK